VLALIFLANLALARPGSSDNASAAVVTAVLLVALFPSGWRNLRHGWPRPSSPRELADGLPPLAQAA
jgi:hypothetical protein